MAVIHIEYTYPNVDVCVHVFGVDGVLNAVCVCMCRVCLVFAFGAGMACLAIQSNTIPGYNTWSNTIQQVGKVYQSGSTGLTFEFLGKYGTDQATYVMGALPE